MNVYTHLQLVDTAGAVETLPSIGLVQRETVRQVLTDTQPTRVGQPNRVILCLVCIHTRGGPSPRRAFPFLPFS